MSLVELIEAQARGPLGNAVERGLGKVGLLPTAQTVYNRIISAMVLRKGEYDVSVGDAEAALLVQNPTEYTRIKSMYEVDVLESILSDIRPDDVFYDIGANVGIYSCLVGDLLTDGAIASFEPHPANAKRLRENLTHNGVEADVFQRALSNQQGEVQLAVAVESHTTSPGHNLIELNDSVSDYSKNSAETITAEMERGDDLIENEAIDPPTVLKVDVEGAELDVLRGLTETLSRDECRVVFCEVHRHHLSKFGGSESELHDLLESCGFELLPLNDHGSKYHLRAVKQ